MSRKIFTFAALLSLMVFAAACGGGSSDSTDTDEDKTTTKDDAGDSGNAELEGGEGQDI